MGLLTLTDFRSEVAQGLQRGSVSTIGEAKLDRWINDAIREFAYAFNFRELEAKVDFVTVNGQYEYTVGTDILATGFRAIHDLGLRKRLPADRLGRVLPEARSTWLKKVGDVTDTTTHGDPKYYHKYGGVVTLRPVPDSTLVTIIFHYWKRITKLTAVGDVSQFDEDWDEVIKVGAQYRALRDYGEHDRYVNLRNDFLGMVRSRVLELDLEEFPEGSIHPVGPNDSEDDLVSG